MTTANRPTTSRPVFFLIRPSVYDLALAILAVALPLNSAQCRELWSYDAGSGTAVAEPQVSFGWTGANLSPGAGNLSFPVEDDLGLGVNAWQLADQSRATTNPTLTGLLDAADAANALSNGWRLSLTVRYLFDFGDESNLGVSAVVGGEEYRILFDLNDQGDLRAQMGAGAAEFQVLTTGGSGPTAYHDFVMEYSPTTEVAELFVDATPVASITPQPTLAPDAVAWGNFGGDQRGVMNYHSISFEILSDEALPGDYNRDGRVDGPDYQLWRATYGAQVASPGDAADGNADGLVDAADYSVWRDNVGAGVEGLLGDYNSDGSVDAADYSVWRDSLGDVGVGLAADGDSDGDVDEFDYSLWRDNYGAAIAAASSPAALVPEATTLPLTAAAVVGMGFGHARRRAVAPPA